MHEISTFEELDALLDSSTTQPVLLFKHSTRCPISAAAHQRILTWLSKHVSGIPPVYMVKVIESRHLSQEIARRLGITHQSPQTLLVQGSQAVWHASHGAINGESLDEAIARITAQTAE